MADDFNTLSAYLPFLSQDNSEDEERKRRLGPYGSQVSLGTRRELAPRRPITESTLDPSTAPLTGFSMGGGAQQPKGEDILSGITGDVATKRSLLAQLIYYGGFGKGAEGQIQKLLGGNRPSILDALNVQASQGRPYNISPLFAGTYNTLPGEYGDRGNRRQQIININGKLMSVFIDDETEQIRQMLERLGQI
jgi:hypothetical protein